MRFHITVPARINVLGNPSDAIEGDFATISAAVNVYAGALVESADGIVLESGPRTRLELGFDFPAGACEPEAGIEDLAAVHRQVFTSQEIPLPYDGELDLMKGAVNRLYAYSPELRHRLDGGIRIAAWSHVPRQSGLGGSSLYVILTLAALREFYDLDRRVHNDYVLAELTQRVEAKELGIACGYADRYIPIFGGIGYADYRGKLYQTTLHEEPYTTYERLDGRAVELPIVAITTGIQHDSGDVHGRMRPRYMEEHNQWKAHGGDPPPMVQFMLGAWETAWRGKIALLNGDLVMFGELMNRNHSLVDQMMTYCGFKDGAGWANNLCIETALENGALGAKLTGAGGGGSVYALTSPGKEAALSDHWRRMAAHAGLDNARIFLPKICTEGLVIQYIGE